MLEFMQFELQSFFQSTKCFDSLIFSTTVFYISFYYHCLQRKMPTLFYKQHILCRDFRLLVVQVKFKH